MTYYAVPAGACMSSTTDDYFCAFEKTHCPKGASFVTPRMLDLDFKDSPALSCINHAVDVPMGQCTLPSDNKLCTGHQSNCKGCYSDDSNTNANCFELNSDECELQPTNGENDGSYALFGMCINPVNPREGHCLWSRDECPSTYNWVTPTKDSLCKCDRVDVGACHVDLEEYICAVSADACDDASQYVSTKRLRELRPDMDCRLCRTAADIAQITSGQQQPSPTTSNEQHYTTVSPITMQNEDESLSNKGCPFVPSNGCSICGEGKCISNPDATFQYPGDPAIKCGELEEAGYQGEIPLEFCPLFVQTNMPDVCGCSSIGLDTASTTNIVVLRSHDSTKHHRKVPIVAALSCAVAIVVIVYVVIFKVDGLRKSFSHCIAAPRTLSSTNSSGGSSDGSGDHEFPRFPPVNIVGGGSSSLTFTTNNKTYPEPSIIPGGGMNNNNIPEPLI